VEYIFNIPGLGSEIVTAVENQDYPMTQGLLLVAGGLVATLNLLADLALSVIDPRVRKGSPGARSSVWTPGRWRGSSRGDSTAVANIPMDAR
jgi:hypothetical protein